MEAFLERNPDYFKLYYKKNFDKLNAYHDKWCEEHIKEIKEYRKKYYQEKKKEIIDKKNKISKTKLKQKKIEKMLKLNEEKAAAFKASLI